MQQLTLDLNLPPPPTLSGFVAGRNKELLATLQDIVDDRPHERFFYIWGDHGAGKSHLLQALTEKHGTLIPASIDTRIDVELAELPLLAVDDVNRLSDAGAIDLFNIYNSMRETSGILLVSGKAPPAQLELRPDLVTRLAWGLVFQVHPLSDDEKIAALQAQAKARGLELGQEIGQYLLTHWRRDMTSLFSALDSLDRYSLETKRPITLPLLREAIGLTKKMALS